MLQEIQNLLRADEDDDSTADPLYEPDSMSSNSEEENIPEQDHVVGDLDPAVARTQVEESEKGRPHKGRKIKNHKQTRAAGKIKRNSNVTYYDYKGRKKDPKQFIDFDCKCVMKCRQNLPVEVRQQEFERFWSLKSYNSQINFIAAAVTEVEKKRCYGRDTEKRKFSRTYRIADKVVCRNMFVTNFRITSFRVNTALKKFHGRAPLTDQRGYKQGGHNKLPDNKVQEVIEQISKIPKYISHYSRTKTEANFLPPGVTLPKMYEQYHGEYDDPVSLSCYKKIFYANFNLRCKALKKDTCNVCDGLKMKIENEAEPEKKEDLKKEHNKHLEQAEMAQTLRRDDFKTAVDNQDHECLTFDLEKTLPLPRIPTNIVFYKRQLWVYNLGIHSGKLNRGFCYVWCENEAGRGAQEVGSCLLKHIETQLAPEVQHLTLWSDSCGGQNRNIKMILLLKHILHRSTQLSDITLKFLCSGHSFLPNDADFSDIESALKHQQRLYLPTEYMNIMKTCRKKNPFVVTKMDGADFVSVSNLEKNIVNRKVGDGGEKVNWLHIKSIRLEKNQPFLLIVQQHSFTEQTHQINIQKKSGRGRSVNAADIFSEPLPLLWPNGKVIADKKLTNLKELFHLIPSDCMEFYNGLRGSSSIQEDVDGFDVENLDFEIDT